MSNETYKIIPEFTNVCTRWGCVICGGSTEKEDVQPVIEHTDFETVCMRCLASGEAGIKQKLIESAIQLEALARQKREQAKAAWDVPTIDEFQAKASEVSAKEYEQWKSMEEDQDIDSGIVREQDFDDNLPF